MPRSKDLPCSSSGESEVARLALQKPRWELAERLVGWSVEEAWAPRQTERAREGWSVAGQACPSLTRTSRRRLAVVAAAVPVAVFVGRSASASWSAVADVFVAAAVAAAAVQRSTRSVQPEQGETTQVQV